MNVNEGVLVGVVHLELLALSLDNSSSITINWRCYYRVTFFESLVACHHEDRQQSRTAEMLTGDIPSRYENLFIRSKLEEETNHARMSEPELSAWARFGAHCGDPSRAVLI